MILIDSERRVFIILIEPNKKLLSSIKNTKAMPPHVQVCFAQKKKHPFGCLIDKFIGSLFLEQSQ